MLSSNNVKTYRNYSLTLNNINPHVVKLQYAVRGPIVIRAGEIAEELKQETSRKRNFDHVIRCNIGDCHATGQKPLTFLRQVVALLSDPEDLMSSSIMPGDAKLRAQRILRECGGNSIGSYSDSTGIPLIRKDVAAFISKRDNLPCDFNNIFLSTGASGAVKSVLKLISTGKDGNERAGVMVPIPQYPLYSATNAEYNAFQIDYFLNEDKSWGLTEAELDRALLESKGKCYARSIVVINPGNPTGQVLDRKSIEAVLRFAKRNNLLVIADEVYQQNVYADGKEFISFKRALHDMGEEYSNSVELASLMSASKGYMGECGMRGGYCELVNFNPQVKTQLYKMLTASLCSSVIGQSVIDVVVNPPVEGESSFESFTNEKNKVLSDLKEKAKLVTKTFNSLPGFSCNEVEGAMYAFPKILLPEKAIEIAKSKDMEPDFMYCLELLEETGICVVPGSGFGQMPGTFHFRITILPPVETMKIVVENIKVFHENFLRKYDAGTLL